jgi:phosphatidylglycerophosphatase A
MFRLISTFFYIGLFPVASGTFSSIIFAVISYFFRNNLIILSVLNVFVFILGIYSVKQYTLKIGIPDPKEVVIDEFSGMLIATFLSKLMFKTLNSCDIFMLFLFFRFFDILKPFPVSYFDKNLKNAYGVMLDDVMAGIMSFFVFVVIKKYFS